MLRTRSVRATLARTQTHGRCDMLQVLSKPPSRKFTRALRRSSPFGTRSSGLTIHRPPGSCAHAMPLQAHQYLKSWGTTADGTTADGKKLFDRVRVNSHELRTMKDGDGSGEALAAHMQGTICTCFDADQASMRIGVKFDDWKYGDDSEHGEAVRSSGPEPLWRIHACPAGT